MKIFDTHSHYNLEPFFPNYGVHWLESQRHGVDKSIVVGTSIETSKQSVEIAATDDNLFAAIGVHPHEYTADYIGDHLLHTIESDVEALQKLILQSKKIKAIGEVGLDYYYTSELELPSIRRIQRKALSHFLQLAVKNNLPVILHVRDKSELAYTDVLEALHSHYHQSSQPFILHCVSGPLSYIKKALELGAYISVAGNVTYKNAQHLRDIVELVPVDRLLIETDAPFLPPQQFRGKTCEPWMISLTAEYLHTELRRDLDQIYENSLQVFNLK